LLKLPEAIQLALQHSSISMGHARALINVKDLETQMNIFNDAVANGFSVREVEQLVRTFAETGYKQTSKPKTTSIPNSLPFSSQQKIHNLSKYLEKDIDIKRNKKGKGKLIIPFNSDDDFISLIEKVSENS
ncbi:MAG: ParB/RepB/Spo0J family partition protein, partial [Flavobacteriales bacterium]